MALKTQNILVLLKLVTERDESWTYSQLAAELDLISSQVHAAVRRIIRSNLALDENGHIRVHTRNLEEFLLYTLRAGRARERQA